MVLGGGVSSRPETGAVDGVEADVDGADELQVTEVMGNGRVGPAIDWSVRAGIEIAIGSVLTGRGGAVESTWLL